ncbi:hypothetical protein D9M68_916020 [compost metagenome]
MPHKLVGLVIHPVHQLLAFMDNGFTLAPGQNGGKKGGNFDILLLAELMRNTYGVAFNKAGPVILQHFGIKKGFYIR